MEGLLVIRVTYLTTHRSFWKIGVNQSPKLYRQWLVSHILPAIRFVGIGVPYLTPCDHFGMPMAPGAPYLTSHVQAMVTLVT